MWAVDAGLAADRARAKLFGILGQNGAGKTTLIKMLCTALFAIFWQRHHTGLRCGTPRAPAGARARIGLVNGEERSFYWRADRGARTWSFFRRASTTCPAQSPASASTICCAAWAWMATPTRRVPQLLQRHAPEARHRARGC